MTLILKFRYLLTFIRSQLLYSCGKLVLSSVMSYRCQGYFSPYILSKIKKKRDAGLSL